MLSVKPMNVFQISYYSTMCDNIQMMDVQQLG